MNAREQEAWAQYYATGWSGWVDHYDEHGSFLGRYAWGTPPVIDSRNTANYLRADA